MSDRSTVLLEHHLKELKLPTFLREYGKVADQCAAEDVDHPGYLLRLSELELIDRHHRMVDRRIKAARFPATKSLDTFDFPAMPSVNKHLVMQLALCEYVDRRENVIAIGNSGTGKTHVALGLGFAACQRGLSVGFTTAASLVHELIEARDERRLLNLQKKLARLNLNPPKEGVALASWSGKGVLLRFWDNGFATKTDPGKGAPNRCYHATTPTASVSPSTTAAWWPMPGCSFPPPWPGISACPNSSGSASTWAMPRGGRTRATR